MTSKTTFRFIIVWAAILFITVNIGSAYVINDSITKDQSILFNWTFNGVGRDGGFTYTYEIEGQPVENGFIASSVLFDWGNLRPDLAGKAVKFTFTALRGATDWKQSIVSKDGTSQVFGGNIKKESP